MNDDEAAKKQCHVGQTFGPCVRLKQIAAYQDRERCASNDRVAPDAGILCGWRYASTEHGEEPRKREGLDCLDSAGQGECCQK